MEGETRLQAVLVAVVLLLTFGRRDENAGKQLTFGRWVEGKVYGPVCCISGTAVVTGCSGRNVSAEWRVIMKVHGNGL